MTDHYETDEFTPAQALLRAQAWIGQADSQWKNNLQQNMVLWAAPTDSLANYKNDSLFRSTLESAVFLLVKNDPNAVHQKNFSEHVEAEMKK